jgi:hypothetical protein
MRTAVLVSFLLCLSAVPISAQVTARSIEQPAKPVQQEMKSPMELEDLARSQLAGPAAKVRVTITVVDSEAEEEEEEEED